MNKVSAGRQPAEIGLRSEVLEVASLLSICLVVSITKDRNQPPASKASNVSKLLRRVANSGGTVNFRNEWWQLGARSNFSRKNTDLWLEPNGGLMKATSLF